MATFNEWLGPHALTPVSAHWFAPSLSGSGSTTDVFTASTSIFTGAAPYQVTLTRTQVDVFGNIVAATTPIVSYNTGTPISIVGDTVSPANEDVFFTTAGASAGTSDIDVQRYDAAGNALGGPATLVAGVAGFEQLRIASAATYGSSYSVAYGTFDTTAKTETITLLTYGTDNQLIASRTLDRFSVAGYDGFGFGTLHVRGTPSFIYLFGAQQDGNVGVDYQPVDTSGALTGRGLFATPRYPAASTSRALGSWSWTRLDETGSGSHDLAIVMPYTYTDAAGAHYAIDVHFIETTSDITRDDTIGLGQSSDPHVTLTRMPGGGLVVGYVDSGTAYLRAYDATGTVTGGSSFALPAGVTAFSIGSLGDGRILLDYQQAVAGGNQIVYAIDDTRQAGVNDANYGVAAPLAGTLFNDTFAITGIFGADTIVGAGGTDFIVTTSAAGSGTVLANLRDGLVSKGDQIDARIYGISGVTVGSDPTVVLGLAAGTDLVYGTNGNLAVYNEGGTDYIHGGTAANTIVGGSGTSIFYGGGGSDIMAGGAGDNFMQAGPTAASSDVFYGAGGRDFVYGGAGATRLVGGAGTESLTGGSGYNELVGAHQTSAFNVLAGGSGTDVFYAGTGTNLFDEGAGTDVFAGNAGLGVIYGGAGRSFVYGGSAIDVVTTGTGNQYLKAGTGQTVFNDTAAGLHAGRFDAIDNFAGGKGTDIYMPTAVQGATRFASQNGGTLITTAVAGGSAQIFVSATSVAAVQAHTHFTL